MPDLSIGTIERPTGVGISGFDKIPASGIQTIGGVGPSQEDMRVKEVSTVVQPEQVNEMSKDTFYSKVHNAIDSGDFQGQTDEQVYNGMLDSITQAGITIPGVAQDFSQPGQQIEEIEEIEEDRGVLDFKTGQTVGEGLSKVGQALKIESKFEIDESENKTLGGAFKNQLKNLANVGRFPVNLIGDAIQLGGELTSLASDIPGTAGAIKDLSVGLVDKLGFDVASPEQEAMIDAVSAELEKNFGTGEAALDTIIKNPVDALLTVVGGAGLAKGALKTAGVAKTAKGSAAIQKLEKLQEIANPVNAVKTELAVAKKVLSPVGETLARGIVKPTGLDFETVRTIVKQPALFKEARKGTLNRQTLADDVVKGVETRAKEISDVGREYAGIRRLNSNVKPREISKLKTNIDDFLKQKSIVVGKDGKLNFDNSNIGATASRKGVQDAYNLVHNRTAFGKGDDFLNLRNSIDDLVDYKTEVGTRGQSVIKGLRKQVDSVAKDKLPGLKELDATFGPQRAEFSKLSKLIFDKGGDLKDNYISVVENITGKGKELKLERIKKIIPNIEEQVKALRALKDVEIASGNKIGTYLSSGVVAGTAATGSIPGAIAVYLATRPQLLVGILRSYTGTKAIANTLAKKIKDGVKLSADEAKKVSAAIKDQAQTGNVGAKVGQAFDKSADLLGTRAKFLGETQGKDLFDFTGIKKAQPRAGLGDEAATIALNADDIKRATAIIDDIDAGNIDNVIKALNKPGNESLRNIVVKVESPSVKEMIGRGLDVAAKDMGVKSNFLIDFIQAPIEMTVGSLIDAMLGTTSTTSTGGKAGSIAKGAKTASTFGGDATKTASGISKANLAEIKQGLTKAAGISEVSKGLKSGITPTRSVTDIK